MSASNARASASRQKIAVQIFSVREACIKDMARTLHAVAQMGYEGLELAADTDVARAGYYGWKAEELRKLLKQCGLTCCGTHVTLDSLVGDLFQETIDFHQTLGCTSLTIHGLTPEYLASTATLLDAAKLLTEIAEKLKAFGMRFGYHSQTRDIKRVEGHIPIEMVLDHAGPDVHLQLDTGHCTEGGADPVALLKKFRNRSRSIHLNPTVLGDPQDVLLGEGSVNWKGVFEFCNAADRIEWYIIEYYQPSRRTSLEIAKLNLKNLREMGLQR